MTKFRNITEQILSEKMTYVSTPKAFDDKIKSWYKAGINPNLVLSYNAMWYGMPSIDKTDPNKATVDMNKRFVIKNVEKNSDNPNVTIQEVEKELFVDKNGIRRWKNSNVGDKIAVPADKLLEILKAPKNKYIWDYILRLDTTKPRDIDPEVWYSKFKAGLDAEEDELTQFADENKDYFDIKSRDDARYIKKYLDRGYPKEFIKKFIGSAAQDKEKHYSPENIAYTNTEVREIEDELNKSKEQYKDNASKIKELSKDDFRANSTTLSRLKSDNAALETKINELETKLAAASNLDTQIDTQNKSNNLKFWNIEDYADEIKKYGIK